MSDVDGEQLHEFVDAECYVDDLYDYLVSDRFAVLHGKKQPRRSEEPINWFIRQVNDRGAKEATGPEFVAYNPVDENFDADDEDGVREHIELLDEARIVSLGDAPRWGDGSAFEEWVPITEELSDDTYGAYTEHPHAAIDMSAQEWMEGLKEALEYRVGPPIAWAYEEGTCYLWGERLDQDTLRDLADACNELERESSNDGMYEGAQIAERAASKVIDGDTASTAVDQRGESDGE